jgi:hypothetical protein
VVRPSPARPAGHADFAADYQEFLDYSRRLNHQLEARRITAAERGFLVSGILIALQHEPFRQRLEGYASARELADGLRAAIRAELERVDLPDRTSDGLDQAFSFIPDSPALADDRGSVVSLINGIDASIGSFMRTHECFDTIGEFYVEFLRYANKDKGLGIVLTPHHIAELFAALADVKASSVVFDNCCGTAGLLAAAMRAMMHDAPAGAQLRRRIAEQVYGIEFQPKIYALAVSSMALQGGGKANIYRADCLKDAQRLIGPKRPSVGLLNPPYKNKAVSGDAEELEFVLNNLDCLTCDGRCVAIVPMTCATAPNGKIAGWKRRIMARHTLEGVLSMPAELFHNSKTTVVTCIMVFTAHRPHPRGKQTWFGYCRDDGLVKTKHRGRADVSGAWPVIRDKWVTAFRNREVIPGFSVIHEVGPTDEWCAEAYLPADYGAVTAAALLGRARRHLVSQVLDLPCRAGPGDGDAG